MAISDSAESIADISRRRLAGESCQSIANDYGCSYQNIDKLCKKWNVIYKRPTYTEKLVQALELIKSGKAASITEAARVMSIKHEALFNALGKKQHADLRKEIYEIIAKNRQHQCNGMFFDQWHVVDGSYYSEGTKQFVECVCTCGTRRVVRLENLRSGLSTGCGCKRREADGRFVIPWECAATGQKVATSKELSKRVGLHQSSVMAKLNQGKTVMDQAGNEWKPLRDESISWAAYMKGPRPGSKR